MSNTDHTKKPGMNSGAAPYDTPVVLLIYTLKSGKSRGIDRGKKTST